jgi:hypothetical protein
MDAMLKGGRGAGAGMADIQGRDTASSQTHGINKRGELYR